MSRLIEFRAWDDKLKVMLSGEDIEHDKTISTSLSYGNVIISRDGVDFDYYELTPIQFTGLTDKNGVKIFEGDVVTWGENIETVIFHDASFETETSCLDSVSFKVIGNIYENPELLES